MARALDRISRQERRRQLHVFARVRAAEAGYAKRLRQVARQIGAIINGWPAADPEALPLIEQVLHRYSRLIEGWASSAANLMLAEVARRDEAAWRQYSQRMGAALSREIREAPTGEVLRERLAAQVELIKSLPIEAAQRVRALTIEGIENSTRAEEIAREIMRSGEVAQSRATLIARTETGRTATELSRARAMHIGSSHFIWRTAQDADVRPLHRKLNGQAFAWDDPPIADERTGIHALPGAIWNCRCYPEPVLPLL